MMKTLLTGAMAAATLAGATLATTGSAQARPWGYYHRGYGGGALVGAGLLGLAAGVAIADRPHYGYGYGPGYYGPRPYYGYYGPAYYGGCRRVWRYDPYIGREVPVRRCW